MNRRGAENAEEEGESEKGRHLAPAGRVYRGDMCSLSESQIRRIEPITRVSDC